MWRGGLALLLACAWVWQGHRSLGVVELYFTTPEARPGAAPRVERYPAGVADVCVYLIYAGARPGIDRYAYQFSQGTSVLLRDAPHTVPVAHGAALRCFKTGGALAPGHYTADLFIDDRPSARLPLVIAARRS